MENQKIKCPRCKQVSRVTPAKASLINRIKRCDKCVSLDDNELFGDTKNIEQNENIPTIPVELINQSLGDSGSKIVSKMRQGALIVGLFSDDQLNQIRELLNHKEKNRLLEYIRGLKMDKPEVLTNKLWEYWYE